MWNLEGFVSGTRHCLRDWSHFDFPRQRDVFIFKGRKVLEECLEATDPWNWGCYVVSKVGIKLPTDTGSYTGRTESSAIRLRNPQIGHENILGLFSSVTSHFLPLRSKCSHHLVLEHSISFTKVLLQTTFHLHANTIGKTIDLYIVFCTFLDCRREDKSFWDSSVIVRILFGLL